MEQLRRWLAENRKWCAADLGGGHKNVTFTMDGEHSITLTCGLVDFVSVLMAAGFEGITIVIETAFQAYAIWERDAFIRACFDNGFMLFVIKDNTTPRIQKLLDLPKTDDGAARAIFHIATQPNDKGNRRCLLRPRLYEKVEDDGYESLPHLDLAWKAKSATANRIMMAARRTGQRSDIIGVSRELLGPANLLPDDLPAALAHKAGARFAQTYLGSMAAITLAASFGTSRREFEGLLGLYQQGHACLLRAEIYYRGMGSVGCDLGRTRGLGPPRYRRALRQVRTMLKDGGLGTFTIDDFDRITYKP